MDKTKRHSILIEMCEMDNEEPHDQTMLYANCIGSGSKDLEDNIITEAQIFQAWDEISGILYRLSIGEYNG